LTSIFWESICAPPTLTSIIWALVEIDQIALDFFLLCKISKVRSTHFGQYFSGSWYKNHTKCVPLDHHPL
jgi:hypothetical protein